MGGLGVDPVPVVGPVGAQEVDAAPDVGALSHARPAARRVGVSGGAIEGEAGDRRAAVGTSDPAEIDAPVEPTGGQQRRFGSLRASSERGDLRDRDLPDLRILRAGRVGGVEADDAVALEPFGVDVGAGDAGARERGGALDDVGSPGISVLAGEEICLAESRRRVAAAVCGAGDDDDRSGLGIGERRIADVVPSGDGVVRHLGVLEQLGPRQHAGLRVERRGPQGAVHPDVLVEAGELVGIRPRGDDHRVPVGRDPDPGERRVVVVVIVVFGLVIGRRGEDHVDVSWPRGARRPEQLLDDGVRHGVTPGVPSVVGTHQ
ncbi:hypothetical protein ABE10_31500 [Bacillus toyonensis]|nr:hypothetical protein [Bacillus toyonensis]